MDKCRCCGKRKGDENLLADAFTISNEAMLATMNPSISDRSHCDSRYLCDKCHEFVAGFCKTIMYPSAFKLWSVYWQKTIRLPQNHIFVQDRIQSILDATSSENSRIARAFVPYIPGVAVEYLLERNSIGPSILTHNMQQTVDGIILLADVSGYTALAETICEEQGDLRGVEVVVTKFLNRFFTKLVALVYEYGGDVVKFAGDAVLCIWKPQIPKSIMEETDPNLRGIQIKQIHELYAQAATLCALNASTNLKESTVFGNNRELALTLHCGLAFGKVSILSVGSELSKREILLTGEPVLGAGNASALAKSGTVVLHDSIREQIKKMTICSPVTSQFTDKAKYWLVQNSTVDIDLGQRANDHIMQAIQTQLPPIKTMLDLLESCIPDTVAKPILDNEKLSNDLRSVSVLFLKIASKKQSIGYSLGQELMLQEIFVRCQTIVTRHGGMIRQFIIDDKGCQLIVCFGVSKHRHKDDPSRAIHTAVELRKALAEVKYLEDGKHVHVSLEIFIGVTTGRAFCGPVGSTGESMIGGEFVGGSMQPTSPSTDTTRIVDRREFAVVGDRVNLAARLMNHAEKENLGLLCDESTYNAVMITSGQHGHTRLEFVSEISVKGKKNTVKVYAPAASAQEDDDTKTGPYYEATGEQDSGVLCFGREKEQKKLEGFISAYSKNILKNPFVMIVGDEGMGKSNFLQWSMDEIGSSSNPDYQKIRLFGIHVDKPFSGGRASIRSTASHRLAYRGLRSVLNELFSINSTDADEARSRLIELVTRLQDRSIATTVDDTDYENLVDAPRVSCEDHQIIEAPLTQRHAGNRFSMPIRRGGSPFLKVGSCANMDDTVLDSSTPTKVDTPEPGSGRMSRLITMSTSGSESENRDVADETRDRSDSSDTRQKSSSLRPFLKKRNSSGRDEVSPSGSHHIRSSTLKMRKNTSNESRSSGEGLGLSIQIDGSSFEELEVETGAQDPETLIDQRIARLNEELKLVARGIDSTTIRVFLESSPEDMADCIFRLLRGGRVASDSSGSNPMLGNNIGGPKPEQVISDLVCVIVLMLLFDLNAAGDKVVFCIDDIQACDEDATNLLRKVLRPRDATAAVPGLMILATIRPADLETMMHAININSYWTYPVNLDSLDGEAVAKLLQKSFKINSWPSYILDKIVEASNGMPFWAIEYMRGLIAQGFVVPDSHGGWEFDVRKGMEDVEQVFPDGLEGAILQQFDNLKEEIWKQAFKWACVLDIDVTVEIIRDLLVTSAVYDNLAELCKMSHVKAEQDRNSEIRETYYAIWDDVNVHGLGQDDLNLLYDMKQMRTKTGRTSFTVRELVTYRISHDPELSTDRYEQILEALVKENFLQRSMTAGEGVYHIVHAYYHQTIYKMIPPKERDWYHLQCAKCLSSPSALENVNPVVVAEHYRIANDLQNATTWYYHAAIFEFHHAGHDGSIYLSRVFRARELVQQALYLIGGENAGIHSYDNIVALKIFEAETSHYLGDFSAATDALESAILLAGAKLKVGMPPAPLRRAESYIMFDQQKTWSMRKRNLTSDAVPTRDERVAENTPPAHDDMELDQNKSPGMVRYGTATSRYNLEDLEVHSFPNKIRPPGSSSLPSPKHEIKRPLPRKVSFSRIQNVISNLRRSDSGTLRDKTQTPFSQEVSLSLLRARTMLWYETFWGVMSESFIEQYRMLIKSLQEALYPNKSPAIFSLLSGFSHIKTKYSIVSNQIPQAVSELSVLGNVPEKSVMLWILQACAVCALTRAKLDECDAFLTEINTTRNSVGYVPPVSPFERLRRAEVLVMSIELAMQYKSLVEAESLHRQLADQAKVLQNPQVSAWSAAFDIMISFRKHGIMLNTDALYDLTMPVQNSPSSPSHRKPLPDAMAKPDGGVFDVENLENAPTVDMLLVCAIRGWLLSDVNSPHYDLQEAQHNISGVWDIILDSPCNAWYIGLVHEVMFYSLCQMVNFRSWLQSDKTEKLNFQANPSNIKVLLKSFQTIAHIFPLYLPAIHRCKGIYYVLCEKMSKATTQFTKAARYAAQRNMRYEELVCTYLAKRFAPNSTKIPRPLLDDLLNFGLKKHFVKAFDSQITAWKEKKISGTEYAQFFASHATSPRSSRQSRREVPFEASGSTLGKTRSAANVIRVGLPPFHPGQSHI